MTNADVEILSGMMLKPVKPEFGIEASLYTAGWNDAIDAIIHLPSAQPDTCYGCICEDAFGYGECYRCKRAFSDMYEVKDEE